MENIYLPYMMEVIETREEAPDIRTIRMKFQNDSDSEKFFSEYKAGQFAEYSYFGEGECTFCVASPPTRKDYIECTFRKVGRVTKGLATAEIGDTIGFRGPYGNIFPIEEWFGKSLLFVTGGIALPPLRCVIQNCLDLRDKFKDITIVYGARSVDDLVYKHELEEWEKRDDVNLVLTVDPGGETEDWKGKVGFVPTVLSDMKFSAKDCIALVCGPPIMIKFTLPVLSEAGFEKDEIFSTLENRMKCGLGKCGRCNVGNTYVCKDGPVFTLTQLEELPQEF
jgi:NAD(P)H-flavin reductase